MLLHISTICKQNIFYDNRTFFMKKLLSVLILLFSFVSPVQAECLYNGQLVPAGTEMSGMVCQEDGSWL